MISSFQERFVDFNLKFVLTRAKHFALNTKAALGSTHGAITTERIRFLVERP